MVETAIALYVAVSITVFHAIAILDARSPKWWPNKGTSISAIAVSAFWPITVILIPIAVTYVLIDGYRQWIIRQIKRM